MTIRLGVIMDAIENISVKKDSTLAMLVAAKARGWHIYYMQQADLYLDSGRAMAVVQALTAVSYDPENYYQTKPSEHMELAEFDVLLMRKDPPFDNEYIYTTYILDAAERQARVRAHEGVYETAAGVEVLRCDFLAALRVAREHRSPEAEVRLVGEAERIGFILRGDDRGDGAEELFVECRHSRGDVAEQRDRVPGARLVGLLAAEQ